MIKVKRRVKLFLLLLLGCIELCTGCSNVGYDSDPKHSCLQYRKDLVVETYRDVLENNHSVLQCCTADDPNVAQYKKQAKDSCFLSTCYTKSVENYCPTRYIDGKAHNYEEILREPCTKGGKEGITAYCCSKGSMEEKLASSFGAEPNEFPHQVKVYTPTNCGGTIYNKNWVITAAHCVVDESSGQVKPASGMMILAGTSLGSNKDVKYKYEVINVTVHKDYSKLLENKKKYGGDKYLFDVALLQLDRDLNFDSPNVKALEIAPEGYEPRDYADQTVMVGWGVTDTLEVSEHLQRANLILRDPDHCFKKGKEWAPHTNYTDYQDQLLCIGGILRGKWSGNSGAGDSGGPAICRGPNGKAVLCGVTSFGADDATCLAQKNQYYCIPSIYARVSKFNSWIKRIAGEQDKDTLYQPFLYGEIVKKGDYDHQVHIVSKEAGKSCGGTLVSEDTVVTAASCVYPDDGKKEHSDIKVYYGLYDLKVTKGSTSFDVEKVHKLEGFKRAGAKIDLKSQGNRIRITDTIYKNNLALLKLDGKAPIDSKEIPKLPEGGDVFKEGYELAFPRNLNHGGEMRGRDFKIVDKKECEKRMGRLVTGGVGMKVGEEIMCGVEKYSGGSICDRELGGGLICKDGNGDDVFCGVQVFRMCEYSIPNAFIDVSKESSWIKLKM